MGIGKKVEMRKQKKNEIGNEMGMTKIGKRRDRMQKREELGLLYLPGIRMMEYKPVEGS